MPTHTWAVANKDKLSTERQLSEYSMCLLLGCPNRTKEWNILVLFEADCMKRTVDWKWDYSLCGNLPIRVSKMVMWLFWLVNSSIEWNFYWKFVIGLDSGFIHNFYYNLVLPLPRYCDPLLQRYSFSNKELLNLMASTLVSYLPMVDPRVLSEKKP